MNMQILKSLGVLKNLLNNFDDAFIKVRTCEAKDKPHIVQVIDFVCAEREWMYSKKFVETPQWLHAFSDINCKSHLLLVAECAGELVGWCRLFPEQCPYSGHNSELGIGLLPDYRNQRIGSSLLEFTLKWAYNFGICRIDLSVHKDNQRALHLFENFGFKYKSNDGDRFLMSSKVQKKDY